MPLRPETESILRPLGVAVEEICNGSRAADSFVSASWQAHHFGLSFTPLRNKRPSLNGWPVKASSNIADLLGWRLASVLRGSACDFGVVTGIATGIWVIDWDGCHAAENHQKLTSVYGPLPPSWRVNTPSGGFHDYYKARKSGEDLRTTSKVLGCDVDVRGWHGQSVVAGTQGKLGLRYCWAPGCAPDEVELAELPEGWFDALPKRVAEDTSSSFPRQRRSSRERTFTSNHPDDPYSLKIGDGPGYGNFHKPINKIAIRYFQAAGADASADKIIAWLRKAVEAAPKRPGRDVSRYLSTEYLDDAVESARLFVRTLNDEN